MRDNLARGVARAKDVRGPRQKKVCRNAARMASRALGEASKEEEILIGVGELEMEMEVSDCLSWGGV